MQLTQENLDDLRKGFNKRFQDGIQRVTPKYQRFTTPVPSTAKIETYAFLDSWPIFQEWLGERQIKNFKELVYQLLNRKFEVTAGLPVDDVADDKLGLLPQNVSGWGQEAGALKDRLAFTALRDGHILPCFDGQNFFDTDHPVKGGVASNMSAAGGSQPWFLLDTTKPLMPILMQERQAPKFDMITDPKSDHVFKNDEFLLGGKARAAAGHTYWQLAYRSTQTLNKANVEAAMQAMAALVDREGEPLAVKPDLIVVGTSNIAAARDLFEKQNLAGGESNTLFKKLEIMEAERLL